MTDQDREDVGSESMTWTNFVDRRSGGHNRTEWDALAIEAERDEAIAIFERVMPGVSPFGVTCWCCGEDYDIEESDGPKESRDHWGSRIRVLTLRAPDYVMTAPWCTYTVNGAVAYHFESVGGTCDELWRSRAAGNCVVRNVRRKPNPCRPSASLEWIRESPTVWVFAPRGLRMGHVQRLETGWFGYAYGSFADDTFASISGPLWGPIGPDDDTERLRAGVEAIVCPWRADELRAEVQAMTDRYAEKSRRIQAAQDHIDAERWDEARAAVRALEYEFPSDPEVTAVATALFVMEPTT